MSTLKIREYSRIGIPNTPGGFFAPVRGEIAFEDDTVVNQTVSFTSSSVQSAAFNAATRFIVAKADVAWCYAVGTNPTATTSMIAVPAGELLFMGVNPASKIAVIAES